jgi:hypothetical protein
MNADQQLKVAIQERITKENIFFNHIKDAIKNAVDKFDLCDTSTSPEVEESVNLSKDKLTEAIQKLKDETDLNKAETDIKGWFLDLAQKNNLVQDSNYVTNPNYFAPTATPVPVAPVASAAPIVNGVPAPRSLADRARGWLRPSNERSYIDRMLGRPDQRWIGNESFPVSPVYQAQPVQDNPYGKSGGKRKTRKYRRKV